MAITVPEPVPAGDASDSEPAEPPEVAVARLRARLADSPEDVDGYLDLVDALTWLADTDPDSPVAPAGVEELIGLLRTALEFAAGKPPEMRAEILARLGHLHAWRFLNTQAAPDDVDDDRDTAIDCLRQALGHADETGLLAEFILDFLPAVLRQVDLLIERVCETGDVRGLDEAVRRAGHILDALPGDHPDRGHPLYQLGLAHALRYDSAGQSPDDLDRTIDYFQTLHDFLPPEHPGHGEVAARLGAALAEHALRNKAQDGDQVNRAVETLTAARELLRADDADELGLHALVGLRLGIMRGVRYLCLGGDDEDLESAIADLGELLNAPDQDMRDTRTRSVRACGNSLARPALGDPGVVDSCHALLAQLIMSRAIPAELRRGDPPEYQAVMARLTPEVSARIAENARAALRHFDAVSSNSELAAMISGSRGLATVAATVDRLSPEVAEQAMAQVDEALRHTDDAADEQAMLEAFRAGLQAFIAVKQGSGPGSDDVVDVLIDMIERLGEDHPLTFPLRQLLGMTTRVPRLARSTEESSAAIERLERALRQTPDDHPARVQSLIKLAFALLSGMWVDRSASSLDRVRELLDAAVRRPAADEANDAVNRVLLNQAIGLQAMVSHDIGAMAGAIRGMRDAADAFPPGHKIHSLVRTSLAALLFLRYLSGTEREYLDAA